MSYNFFTTAGQAKTETIPLPVNAAGYTLTAELSNNRDFQAVFNSKSVTGTGRSVTLPLSASEVDALKSGYYRIKGVKAGNTDYLQSGNILYTPAPSNPNVGYTDEQVRDTIAAALTAGSGITITPNDGADTITIAATGGGGGATAYLSGAGIFNLKDYGAVGNGTTDDRAAMSAAMVAAGAYATVGKVATIWAPPGTYRINLGDGTAGAPASTIGNWPNRVSLVGSGRERTKFAVYTVNSTGTTVSGVDRSFIANNNYTAADPGIDMTFSDFTMDCSGTNPGKTGTYTPGNGKGFFMVNLLRCAFKNLDIFDTKATSIGVDSIRACEISGNRIYRGGRSSSNGSSGIGIGTGGNAVEPSRIVNNYVEDCGNNGIFVEKQGGSSTPFFSFGTIIVGNVVVGCRTGIGENGAGGTLIASNFCAGATQYGIEFVSGNASAPYTVGAAVGTLVQGNQVWGAVEAGIKAGSTGGVAPVIRGNRVVGVNPITGAVGGNVAGIQLILANAPQGSPRVVDNDVELNAGAGIYCFVGSGVTTVADLLIERNRVRSNGRVAASSGGQFGIRLRQNFLRLILRDNEVWDDVPSSALLATSSIIGDTTLTLAYNPQQGLPAAGVTYLVDSETVTPSAISAVIPGANPAAATFTMTVPALTAAHASGATIKQTGLTQINGISCASGPTYTDPIIIGNISRLGTAPFVIGATITNGVIRDNIGYNPVGAASLAATASPMTITAGPTPETIYVSGGTVSSITKGGINVGVTSGPVRLEPNQSMVVTYTVAPTLTRDRS